MQLLNDFFKIVESAGTDLSFVTKIRMEPDHLIYKGHFPGYPVTPGVIFIQIVHELIEHHLKTSVCLTEMTSSKFLKIVNPLQENVAVFQIDLVSKDGFIRAKTSAENSSGIFFKMSSVYKPGTLSSSLTSL